MHTLAIHNTESTRHFLDAMSAQAHLQLAEQNLAMHPELAVQAHGHLDLETVLDLLRD
jgi:hypothetical protein